jgi:hypothetical protein
MKRQGFVSNSSSSSFVIVGFQSDMDWEEAEEKDLYRVNEQKIVGKLLARWEYDNPELELSFVDLEKIKQEVEKVRDELKIASPVKLYTGMEYC